MKITKSELIQYRNYLLSLSESGGISPHLLCVYFIGSEEWICNDCPFFKNLGCLCGGKDTALKVIYKKLPNLLLELVSKKKIKNYSLY